MVDLQVLSDELTNDTANIGYGPFIPDCPGNIVDMINSNYGDTKTVSRLIGIGTILDALGPDVGSQVLDTLDTMKTQSSMIKWAWHLLDAASLDIGLASTRAQLDALVEGGILPAPVSAALKTLAEIPATRAEKLFGPNTRITEEQIRNAIALKG